MWHTIVLYYLNYLNPYWGTGLKKNLRQIHVAMFLPQVTLVGPPGSAALRDQELVLFPFRVVGLSKLDFNTKWHNADAPRMVKTCGRYLAGNSGNIIGYSDNNDIYIYLKHTINIIVYV